MNRWTWLLLGAATVAPGCVTIPEVKEPIAPKPVREATFEETPPPVMPEQVNAENYEEKLQQLKCECERELAR